MATEVQWSELQRDPKSVAALADQGDVRVRRRDGAPLLLIREDRAAASADGSVTAARFLRALVTHLPVEDSLELLGEQFPWIDLLPEDAQRKFVIDFARAVQVSAELEQWHVLSQLLTEWKSTAAIYADPELHAELTRPIDDDFGPVPPPEGS